MCQPAFGETKGKNYFSGFASLTLFLRGWGGVFSILRKTSSGLRGGSSFLRDESGFIGKPSENGETDETYQTKAKLLLRKASCAFHENLADGEYGMPYADEKILTAILNEMMKLGLTNPQSLEKVLQFLPKNQRCLER